MKPKIKSLAFSTLCFIALTAHKPHPEYGECPKTSKNGERLCNNCTPDPGGGQCCQQVSNNQGKPFWLCTAYNVWDGWGYKFYELNASGQCNKNYTLKTCEAGSCGCDLSPPN